MSPTACSPRAPRVFSSARKGESTSFAHFSALKPVGGPSGPWYQNGP
jgi:hypothetical protein